MAPMLVDRPRWLKAFLAYCVTDEKLCLAVTRQKGRWSPVPGRLLDPLYAAWVIGTAIGVLLGAQVPADWVAPLKAVFPLVFLVLTVLLCTSVRGVGGRAGRRPVRDRRRVPAAWLEHRDRRLPGEPRRFTPGTRPPPARARVTISRSSAGPCVHDRQLSSRRPMRS